MTNKERASYALEMAKRRIDSGEGWADAVRFVGDAITAAVEEEREACAKIADYAARLFEPEAKAAYSADNQYYYEGKVELARAIAIDIRNRCNKSATQSDKTLSETTPNYPNDGPA